MSCTEKVEEAIGFFKNRYKVHGIPTGMLNFLKIKMPSQKATGPLLFIYLHNRCSLVNPDDFHLPLGECCHQHWFGGVGEKMSTPVHLKTCFYKIKGNLYDEDKPSLLFRRGNYLNMNDITTGHGNSHRRLRAGLRKKMKSFSITSRCLSLSSSIRTKRS